MRNEWLLSSLEKAHKTTRWIVIHTTEKSSNPQNISVTSTGTNTTTKLTISSSKVHKTYWLLLKLGTIIQAASTTK
jgi:hypothetical protein